MYFSSQYFLNFKNNYKDSTSNKCEYKNDIHV